MTPTPETILRLLDIDYQQKSGRLAFCCPLHDDRDPSAAFYLDTNLAHCFACSYTADPIQFYAKVTHKARATAIRDLERTLGPIDEPKLRADGQRLAKARRAGEKLLKSLRHLPRKEHALKAETLDRILLAYERGQINDTRLDKLLSAWTGPQEQTEDAPDLT